MPHLDDFVKQCHDNIACNKNIEVEKAIDYLARRDITSKTMALHKIGYCCNKDSIPSEIRFFGNKDLKVPKDYEYYIRNRIIVPIYDEFRTIVGLATRKPSFEAGNTWWNLARPFKKGDHLFLLDKVRKDVFDANKIYLVEGYVDAIMLHQAGLKNVVAIMGTNLSARKIALILRYCNNVCICMDADKNQAGQKGQAKIISALRKLDYCDSISIIDGLPTGQDPDEYIVKNGLAEFLKLERTLGEAEISSICKQVAINEKGR